jgi:hypothetical protein
MLNGLLVAESLRLGAELCVERLSVTRVTRRDVSPSATATPPSVWTFLDFEAEDEAAADVAHALSEALLAEGGWYADFRVGTDRVIVFADQIFRYRAGDQAARAAAVAYGESAGVPEHQLDWDD